MNKLVLWDDAWLPWAGKFEQELPPGWRMVAGSGLSWLTREIEDA